MLNLRSRLRRRLDYTQRSIGLIGGDDPAFSEEVEINFRHKKVPRLTKNQILLWNSGTVTIRGSDVASTDPIRFVFTPEVEVLKASVAKVGREVNKLKVGVKEGCSHEVVCEFEYLDRNDGGVIEILHTGSIGEAKVSGTIVGNPQALKDWGTIEGMGAVRKIMVLGLVLGVFILGTRLILPGGLDALVAENIRMVPAGLSFWTDIFFGSFLIIGPGWMLWLMRQRIPGKLYGAIK